MHCITFNHHYKFCLHGNIHFNPTTECPHSRQCSSAKQKRYQNICFEMAEHHMHRKIHHNFSLTQSELPGYMFVRLNA